MLLKFVINKNRFRNIDFKTINKFSRTPFVVSKKVIPESI